MLAEGAQSVVVDLADLTFIDSTGLRLLLVLSQQARAEGWRMLITRRRQMTEGELR